MCTLHFPAGDSYLHDGANPKKTGTIRFELWIADIAPAAKSPRAALHFYRV